MRIRPTFKPLLLPMHWSIRVNIATLAFYMSCFTEDTSLCKSLSVLRQLSAEWMEMDRPKHGKRWVVELDRNEGTKHDSIDARK